jgi:integrase
MGGDRRAAFVRAWAVVKAGGLELAWRGVSVGRINRAAQAIRVHVRHNRQDLEGIRPPKNGEPRDAPCPGRCGRPGMPGQAGPLVFGRKDGKPLCNGCFRLGLIADLEAIGISAEEQRRRNISFHSLRHSFVTLSRALGVSDFEIQALAGHKSAAMMERYSHARQVVHYDSARRRIDGFFSARKPPGLIGPGQDAPPRTRRQALKSLEAPFDDSRLYFVTTAEAQY